MHPVTIRTTPDFVDHWILPLVQFLQKSRFALHVAGKFRRMYLVHFRKTYVQRQLAVRKGKCRQCGTCCNLLITCPMLARGGGCLVYGKCRPEVCKVFPIDQKDIDEVAACGRQCGYHFGPSRRRPAMNHNSPSSL